EPLLIAREPRLESYLGLLRDFREWVLTEVDAQANYTDRYAPPALQTYDRDGEVVNRIVANPVYDKQHQECYRRGIIGLPYKESAPHLLSFTMGFLLSQADISLHCPVTLTGAVAYVLGYHADEKLRTAYLHDVVCMDGKTKTGGTWATEKHGGSDVGATTTEAVRNGDKYALHGLKWFTSNANSGLAVATARPDGAPAGSAGLGLYLVPSHLAEGIPNHYRIRRLKDKLGTKGLPTGEIELLGAEAFEIAPPPDGFKMMMAALEYSRVHNAVGAAGVQRRALREALAWAKSRDAFGHKLVEYPMVQDELLRVRVGFEAGALLAFEAAQALDAALPSGTTPLKPKEGLNGAPESAQQSKEGLNGVPSDQHTWLRLVTALAKYLTAEDAINSSRAALELIGGNGYTSDYPMARILRDAQVLTVWEGPANIQALELLRLLSPKYAGAQLYERRVREIANRLPGSLSTLQRLLDKRLTEDHEAIKVVTADQQSAQRYARKLLHRLSQSLGFALMCGRSGDAHLQGDDRAVLTAIRYHEEIERPAIGGEDPKVQHMALELIDDEQGMDQSYLSAGVRP
ncbi:MAG TPA: acyl-CoA dehydrogenase family protein, partial [Terriglobales bacterium]|nr:acyl-CoA dehydrogenase family protein [Terriglobales bacterium]